MTKRLLSLALSLAMVLTMTPLVAGAEGDASPPGDDGRRHADLPAWPPFFAPCRRSVGAGPPGGVDLGTAFLHHLDRKAFQEYFAK